jgi:hypothetical protein
MTFAYKSEAGEGQIEDLLTERPTLAFPRLCHNAQAELLRKQQVLGSNPSVGSTPPFRAQQEQLSGVSTAVATSEPAPRPANWRRTANWTDFPIATRPSMHGLWRLPSQASPSEPWETCCLSHSWPSRPTRCASISMPHDHADRRGSCFVDIPSCIGSCERQAQDEARSRGQTASEQAGYFTRARRPATDSARH